MAKRKTTAKQTTPKTDWQQIALRQRQLINDTSMAVFELEMSLKFMSDKFCMLDHDVASCLIGSFARTASDIQNNLDMHLSHLPYMASVEAE